MFELLKIVLGGIIGGFVGAYFQHKFASRRDKETGLTSRRRVFRAFICGLKSEIACRCHNAAAFGEFYQGKIPGLQRAAAEVADDFSPKRRAVFENLVSTACSFRGTASDGSTKPIVETLDAILNLIEE